MVIQRGEIWWATLPDPVGSEPGYRRPVLVVQADSFNQGYFPLRVDGQRQRPLSQTPSFSQLWERGEGGRNLMQIDDFLFVKVPPRTCWEKGLGGEGRPSLAPTRSGKYS